MKNCYKLLDLSSLDKFFSFNLNISFNSCAMYVWYTKPSTCERETKTYEPTSTRLGTLQYNYMIDVSGQIDKGNFVVLNDTYGK